MSDEPEGSPFYSQLQADFYRRLVVKSQRRQHDDLPSGSKDTLVPGLHFVSLSLFYFIEALSNNSFSVLFSFVSVTLLITDLVT